MPESIVQKLLNSLVDSGANNTELEKKRLQYFEKGNHIAKAAYAARAKEVEGRGLQSAGYWLYGTIGIIIAIYMVWLLIRHCRLMRNYKKEVVVNAKEMPNEKPLLNVVSEEKGNSFKVSSFEFGMDTEKENDWGKKTKLKKTLKQAQKEML